MSGPGKIVLLLLSALSLYGGVTATLDRERAHKGETVTLTLSIEGETFEAPTAMRLCSSDSPVLPEHTRTLSERDGTFQKQEQYRYRFEVREPCTIAPLKIVIDGVENYTPPLAVDLYGEDDKKTAPVRVTMRSSKQAPYVGEPFILEAVLRQDAHQPTAETEFLLPETRDLWIKQRYELNSSMEGATRLQTMRYLVTPQRAGDLQIDPVTVNIAEETQSVDAWGNRRTERHWQPYYTNPLTLHVRALPEGVKAVGEFTLVLRVDDDTVEVGTPVHALVTLRGRGNFEDIVLVQPVIPDVEIFSAGPEREAVDESGAERLTQRLTFVADHDFTIPPVTLDYFDPETQRLATAKTSAVTIHVSGGSAAPAAGREATEKGEAVWGWTVMYVLGFLSAAVVLIVPWRRYLPGRKEDDGEAGDVRRALMELLAHKDEADARAMIERLEKQLYGGSNEAVDAKALKRLLKKYRK